MMVNKSYLHQRFLVGKKIVKIHFTVDKHSSCPSFHKDAYKHTHALDERFMIELSWEFWNRAFKRVCSVQINRKSTLERTNKQKGRNNKIELAISS